MYIFNILKTIVAKSGILVLNFIIVLCTTHFWGAEGRGIISLLTANIAIIVTVNNIFSGSSIAFHISKNPSGQFIRPAILWILAITLLFVPFFSIFQKNANPIFLFTLTVLTSLTNFNQSVFIGKEKINLFNIYNFLIPLFTLLFILVLHYTKISTSEKTYFWSYGAAYLLIWLISLRKINVTFSTRYNFGLIKSIFNYGYKNELSYFLHFLNYRLSYFVILHYLGFKALGVYSIGIALAESLWIISSSISVVHFSKVLNSGDKSKMVKVSNQLALVSLLATSFFGIIILLIPSHWFGLLFGKDFTPVKQLFMLLFPGILFQSFSSIYGHYLSATGQIRPLIIRSSLGLVATLIFTFILIPNYGLKGACITTIISYTISSLYICIVFFRRSKTRILI
jgi:O-antigen/teichoic acid export membrane protein